MTQTAIQHEALNRATSGLSVANYALIYEGFTAKGISPDQIQPRENVLTFHAWKALGRVVRKGEHGVKVCTFVPVMSKKTQENGEQGTGYKMPRNVTVFHISQTDELQQA
jgi:antirestriction protein ArdC